MLCVCELGTPFNCGRVCKCYVHFPSPINRPFCWLLPTRFRITRLGPSSPERETDRTWTVLHEYLITSSHHTNAQAFGPKHACSTCSRFHISTVFDNNTNHNLLSSPPPRILARAPLPIDGTFCCLMAAPNHFLILFPSFASHSAPLIVININTEWVPLAHFIVFVIYCRECGQGEETNLRWPTTSNRCHMLAFNSFGAACDYARIMLMP